MNAIVLLGPPGAGKGTIAEVIVDKGYQHISTGDLLREQIRLETPLGLEAKKLMDQGQFVPDEVVIGMIRDLLVSAPAEKFLFDGFPRTLVQAEKLDELLTELNGQMDQVLLLKCPASVIVERLSGRRSCPDCKTVYHVTYNAPKLEGVCDVDGCSLTYRDDDVPETIRKRLSVYAEQTTPLICYYKDRDLVMSIDANQSIDQVRSAVRKLVE
ncbi:MAG TPA: adenylate kinase [Pontiella sp.]